MRCRSLQWLSTVTLAAVTAAAAASAGSSTVVYPLSRHYVVTSAAESELNATTGEAGLRRALGASLLPPAGAQTAAPPSSARPYAPQCPGPSLLMAQLPDAGEDARSGVEERDSRQEGHDTGRPRQDVPLDRKREEAPEHVAVVMVVRDVEVVEPKDDDHGRQGHVTDSELCGAV